MDTRAVYNDSDCMLCSSSGAMSQSHSATSEDQLPVCPPLCPETISLAYAATLNNIGVLRHRRGDSKEAMMFYRQALVERMETPRAPDMMTPEEIQDIHMRFLQAVREEEFLLSSHSDKDLSESDWTLDIYESGEDLKAQQLPSIDRPILIDRDDADCQDELGCSAICLYNLGLLYCQRKNFDVALDLFKTAQSATDKCSLSLKERLKSLIHNGVGWTLLLQGNQSQALKYFTKATKSDQAALCKVEGVAMLCDPSVVSAAKARLAQSQSNMGRAYFALGEYELAMYWCKDSLRLRIEALGVNHINVAATLCSIGIIYREMGDLDEALDHCRWFVHAGRDLLGLVHPQLRRALVTSHNIRKEMGLLKNVSKAAAAA